jgi:hypothetical protein
MQLIAPPHCRVKAADHSIKFAHPFERTKAASNWEAGERWAEIGFAARTARAAEADKRAADLLPALKNASHSDRVKCIHSAGTDPPIFAGLKLFQKMKVPNRVAVTMSILPSWFKSTAKTSEPEPE